MEIKDTYVYNSVDVANYIIAQANERQLGINMTKLQKLLFIAYGSHLILSEGFGRLTDEQPQAWPFGPVFENTRAKLLEQDFSEITVNNIKLKDDAYLYALTNFVFKGFGNWNADKLTAWSHASGSPWEKTTLQNGFNWGDIIPDEYIAEYFKRIIIVNESAK